MLSTDEPFLFAGGRPLGFRTITLSDKETFKNCVAADADAPIRGSDYAFGNSYIWREPYNIEAAMRKGLCLTKSRYVRHGAEMTLYGYPFGAGDVKEAVCAMFDDALYFGDVLRLRGLTESDCCALEEMFPGAFDFTETREEFDYLYTAERLSTLAGKKLAAKRNHIARFKDDPDWAYEDVTRANVEECRAMARKWFELYAPGKPALDMEREQNAIACVFDKFDALGLTGGLLRRGGNVVAFAFGEPVSDDTFLVIIEKAYQDIQGAYQMINQQFTLKNCQRFTYVNRQEDEGDEGLRKSKLSYCPDILLAKYFAVVKERVYYDLFGDPRRHAANEAFVEGMFCRRY